MFVCSNSSHIEPSICLYYFSFQFFLSVLNGYVLQSFSQISMALNVILYLAMIIGEYFKYLGSEGSVSLKIGRVSSSSILC